MAATYVDIPASDLDAFLTGKGYSVIPTGQNAVPAKSGGLASTREVVYGRLRRGEKAVISIRVYTTLDGGHQRDQGDDAIRVVMVTRLADGGIKTIHTFKRVHRVAGWRKNLAARLDEADKTHFALCPKCSGIMVERTGKRGPFLGCVNYPTCNGIRRINEDCPML